ncbi:MAG: Nif3-like dinuclear metal center hexameric protein [Clostridiales bacterium]|jgi:dinuclear metal center YbgI/SA1388 family protein|nr:Nif3-like dinuclear metal center hexameric protein [Clostridiales bacterium]
MKVQWVIDQMRSLAPENSAVPSDNVGLLVGETEANVTKILVALDCTQDVVREAVEYGADMIVTHHPLIYAPINRVNSDTAAGQMIIQLIRAGISVYAAHTNLDRACGGVNDCLMEKIGFAQNLQLLQEGDLDYGLVRYGRLGKPMTLINLAKHVKTVLKLSGVRYAGDAETMIHSAGICCGGGSDMKFFEAAKEKGCEVFITGDIGYHDFVGAKQLGICLIDATHFASEWPVVTKLASYLRDRAAESGFAADIRVSVAEVEPFATT